MGSPKKPTEVLLQEAEEVILRWNSVDSHEAKLIFHEGRAEVNQYLQAVDDIQRLMLSVSVGDTPDKVASTIQIAMARLEDEFRSILLNHGRPLEVASFFLDSNFSSVTSSVRSSTRTTSGSGFHLEEEDSDAGNEDFLGKDDHVRESAGSSDGASCRSTNSIREIDLIPSDAIYDLRSIAERMISAGYTEECVRVYGSVRSSAVEATFRKLGTPKLSISDIQRLEWYVLEVKIKRWIREAKFCVRILFPSEKRLCQEIFDGLGTSMDVDCFVETVKSPAIQLFNFAEAISISHLSPEKLFKILDLHDALSDLLPDLNAIFQCRSLESVSIQVVEILSRLAEGARMIFLEFENAVLHEPSKVQIPGGTLHPLTRYVMNYISLISDYKQTLIDLVLSKPSTGSMSFSNQTIPDIKFAEVEGPTPLSLHLIWIIVVLLSNLDFKSKHYKDTSLTHLFIMNNVHYIVQKIKGSSELREMIGDEYLRELTRKYLNAATSYQRSTWIKVLHCLRDEGIHQNGSFSSGISKSVLKERFKSFNSIFDEVHQTQAVWMVPDSQLRDELRVAILENLIPAYRSFLGRFRSHIESERHPETYIKYSVEDLENAVLNFFEGCPISLHSRRRSH